MYRSNPFRSTMNTNVITALGMCNVCTEAIHSVARKRQDWTCESTCEHENAKTRKRENGRNQPVDAKTAKTRKRPKRRKQENRENGENAKTAKTRKRENGENGQKCSCFLVFNFSFSGFLGFLGFLVFSLRWPHPSGQVAFFMCLAYFYQSKIVAFHKLVMRYLLGVHLTGKFIRTEFGLTVPDVQRWRWDSKDSAKCFFKTSFPLANLGNFLSRWPTNWGKSSSHKNVVGKKHGSF